MAGLTEILAKENRFKLSSLEANQRGELTAEQTPLLISRFFSSLMFILVPGAVLIYQLIRGIRIVDKDDVVQRKHQRSVGSGDFVAKRLQSPFGGVGHGYLTEVAYLFI